MEQKIEFLWIKGEGLDVLSALAKMDEVSLITKILYYLFEHEIIGDDEDEAGKWLGNIFDEQGIRAVDVVKDVFQIKTTASGLTKDINKRLASKLEDLRIIAMIDDCPECGRETEYFEDSYKNKVVAYKRCHACGDFETEKHEPDMGLYNESY